MSSKQAVIALVISLALVSLIILTASSKNQEPKIEPTTNRLKWNAAEGKKEGKQRVIIPSRNFEYLGSSNTSMEQVLRDYTLVLAQPVEERTIQVSDNDLVTWYKFTILEFLTPLKAPTCANCVTLTPPADMALNSNEFWVLRNGGRLMVDGVVVEQQEAGFPQFEYKQKYLLFVLWHPNKVAIPAGGPRGVFTSDDHETLTSLHTEADVIQTGIRSRFHGSLAELRKECQSQ